MTTPNAQITRKGLGDLSLIRLLRTIHRGIGAVAALFMMLIAVTGILLVIELHAVGPLAAVTGRGHLYPASVHFLLMNLHTLFLFGKPGAVMLVVVGISLTYFSVSGMWMYVTLWRTWRKRKPLQSGAHRDNEAPVSVRSVRAMRTIHRWSALPIALVLLVMPVTGVAMIYNLWHGGFTFTPTAYAERAANALQGPGERQGMGERPGVGERPGQRTPPAGGLGFQAVMFFTHTGYIAGRTGEVIILLAGGTLIAFSFTGAWMYIDMYWRRRRVGRKGLLWF
jgi:uncharacterized iron-regulated membrane protein